MSLKPSFNKLKMEVKLIVLFALMHTVLSVPIKDRKFVEEETSKYGHIALKRFVNPSLPLDGFSSDTLRRIRTRRSVEDECEQLDLCKLHASMQRNFISAFELYFVNKENARLWDHQSHTISDCYQLYNC